MKNKIETDLLISELIYKYLRHQISRDEQEILDSWAESEENRAFFTSLKESDRLYKGLINTHYQDKEVQFNGLQRRIRQKKYRNIRKMVAGVAAMLTIVVGSLLLFVKEQVPEENSFLVHSPVENLTFLRTIEGKTIYLPDSVKEISQQKPNKIENTLIPEVQVIPELLKYNVLSTSFHGKIEVMLADSTRVWLNAGSELRYPEVFGKNERRVYLTGEAYFEVAKKLHNPFIVKTEKAEIEVLGTHFNINTYRNNSCITTLVEGGVKILDQFQDSVLLRPGQQAVAGPEPGIQIQEVDVRYYIAWKRNQFAFQDATLYQIMTELADWYDFTFEFENLGLGNHIFTAIIPCSENVDGVLQLLERTDDFRYSWKDENHIAIHEK